MNTELQDAQTQALAVIPTHHTAAVTHWEAPTWDAERTDLLRKTLVPPTASALEFEFYLAWCKRTGLDPFLKQAYLVERWDAQNNTKKHEPMAAEAGMAARADAMPDFGGMKSGVVYAGDEFMIDEITQEITHRWSAEARAKQGGKVLGAWAHGKRTGRVVEITYVTFESRCGRKKDGSLTKFWLTDPAGQIRKCARADQYRRLFPNIFAGVYAEEEKAMFEHERDVTPTALDAGDKQAKSKALAEKLGVKKVEASKLGAPAHDAVTGEVTPQKTAAPPIDCVRFGPVKGKRIADCTTAELSEAVDVAQKALAQATGKEPWCASVHEGLKAVHAEVDRRLDAASEAMPEPGSEG
jgi:phage recombination protein Bet